MNTNEQTPKTALSGMNTNRRIQLGLVAVLIVVAAGMYAWKAMSVGAVEEKLAEVEAQHVMDRTQLIEKARQLDARHSEAALRQFSTPFSWAIRREVMASNLDQVNQYFDSLVQIEGFQSVVFAQPDGKLVAATDRKQLAAPFSSLYPEQYLQASEIKIESVANGNLRAVIPILGLDKNLGTVVLEYTPAAYALQ